MAKYSYTNLPQKLISAAPSTTLKSIVCIPCYNEPDIATTIDSFLDCVGVNHGVELVVLINESEECLGDITTANQHSYETCLNYNAANTPGWLSIYPIYIDNIPLKKAGVGMARKLAMDEAHQRFKSIGVDRGAIICMDADTTVMENYLSEIQNFFNRNLKLEACSIAFEHKLENAESANKAAICDYELHLRYFINMQRLINLPFAYQTVGSAMAVTSMSYQKLGGMNTRKAGEDFYFLHKFIKNGVVGEINTTCVFPSSRISDRVPFGTGKAVGEIVKSETAYLTYASSSFFAIDKFLVFLPEIYDSKNFNINALNDIPNELMAYLISNGLEVKIKEIKSNTTSFSSFEKRFYHWFDAFRLMKCLHYLRDNSFPNVSISEAIEVLFEKLAIKEGTSKISNLETLREYDKTQSRY